MSLEDQYDAWVRGLMGGGRYAATPKQAENANDAVQQMQAQLDALTEAQKRQTAAGSALNAVQKAGAATAESVRRMSSELTKSLKQDGLLGGTVAAPSPAPCSCPSPRCHGMKCVVEWKVGQVSFAGACRWRITGSGHLPPCRAAPHIPSHRGDRIWQRK